LKVGLTWAGRASHTNDRNRSIRADDLAALMNIPRAIFFSLQKDPLNSAARLSGIVDNASELHDFVETASLIENLDLVITVDTAVAHLAGALGKETWILLPYDSDWRWLIGRSDSPWYPSVRLFRQPAPRDWHSVFRTVAEELGRRSSP
jgi:ADP-heptose:LPS heptosyltransferase